MNQFWLRYLPLFVREKLEGRHTLQNIISNTGWLFADNILRMGIGLLVGIWVTRYLGPEQFGRLSFAIAFVSLFSSISLLGLDGIVIRNLVRNPSRRTETLGCAFALKFVGSMFAAGIALAAVIFLRPTDNETWGLVGITCLGQLFQAFGVIDFWFQSQVQSKYPMFARSAALLICSAGKVFLILSHAPLVAFAWIGLAETALGTIGMVIAYRVHGHHLKAWRARVPMAKELLADSWPLILTDIVTTTYMRVDKIIIGEIAGNNELGIFTVATLLADALLLAPRAISTSLFPSIVEAKGVSDEVFYHRLQQYYNLMVFLAYAVALPVTIFAGWLVPLLFGPAYIKAVPILIGLVWTGIFINFWIALSYYMTVMNWSRLYLLIEFIACAGNIAINLLLIPRYGGMGAVIASCVAYMLATLGACYLFAPLRRTGFMLTKALVYPKIW